MSIPGEGAPSQARAAAPETALSFEVGKVLEGVTFEERKNGILGSGWVSSSPEKNRKAVVARGFTPTEGEAYSVKIVEDTNPKDPLKGKYIVELMRFNSNKKAAAFTAEDWHAAEEALNETERTVRRGRAASNTLYKRTDMTKDERARKGIRDSRLTDVAKKREREGRDAERDLDSQETLESLAGLRHESLVAALRADKELELQEDALRKEEQEMIALKDTSGSAIQVLREVRAELESVRAKREELVSSNPEAFMGMHLKQLREYRTALSEGKLAETPYVKEALDDLETHLRAGQPVFVYGHLGSGKTELALNVASRLNKNGALVISGAKDIALSELYGHQTLEIDKIDTQELSNFSAQIEEEFTKWKTANENAKPEDVERAHQRILQTHLATLQGGTVSKFFLGPIYRAMQEGRPIILDEVNAIPHDVLISLNHVLTRKPGDKVIVQQNSGSEITVKEGFGFILTGNLNQGSDVYVDRQEMDPAFLSRLYKFEYDYLPQSVEGSISDENKVSESELFHLVLASLMSRQGDMELPDGSPEKLWDLAKAARVTQNVFSGKTVAQAFYFQEGGSRPTPYRLREGVLSNRALRKVLNQWQSEGYRHELDHYIWKEFISQSTVPADRAYLYQLFKDRFGFFKSSGWEQKPNYGNSGAVTSFDIQFPENPSEDTTFYSARDTVEFAFGEPPARSSFPKRKKK